MLRSLASKALIQRLGLSYVRNLSASSSYKKPFDKILIANRGEIACRIIRTARKMGIKTVAVYSDVDRNAEHVKMADEAVHIGPSPASESYLVAEKILAACKATGAQAVHPGYGFLSENLQFCDMLTKAGIEFIGPPVPAIRAMGSKSESKDIMIAANVPVTPGYHGSNQDDDHLFKESKRVGYPVMIKACNGGGGKGMRAVFKEEDFHSALQACRREALKSFGDSDVLIERLVQAPRHVELQVFGDKHGGAVHLLERDCSIQRRHQKVLEEAPAPNLTPAARKAMHAAAVACAKAVGYVGAGTVEFLVDSKTSEFFFCEMNTRLQVEHPVTEQITGVDLVEWQLRIAAGERIPMSQDEIVERAATRGCALEARIYAENPVKEFLPQTGHLYHLRTPVEHSVGGTPVENSEDGVRVDSGVVSGNNISSFYDPMISKLIVHAPSRPEALAKMERALRRYQVSGLANNIDFLVKIVQHPGFAEAQPTTAFFGQHMDTLLGQVQKNPSPVFLDKHATLGFLALSEAAQVRSTGKHQDVWDSKTLGANWRIGRSPVGRSFRNVTNMYGESIKELVCSSRGDAQWSLATADAKGAASGSATVRTVRFARGAGADVAHGSECWDITAEVGGILVQGTVATHVNTTGAIVLDVWVEGQTGVQNTHGQFIVPAAAYSAGTAGGGAPVLKAPMPGQIVKLLVKSGETVKQGQPVCILNAMKMEHVVNAPISGVVSLACDEGQQVADGAVLAEIAAPKEKK